MDQQKTNWEHLHLRKKLRLVSRHVDSFQWNVYHIQVLWKRSHKNDIVISIVITRHNEHGVMNFHIGQTGRDILTPASPTIDYNNTNAPIHTENSILINCCLNDLIMNLLRWARSVNIDMSRLMTLNKDEVAITGFFY